MIMTIIQYQKIPQKDMKILSQCNSLDANLDFAGFQSQEKQNRISRPKARKKCSWRDPGRECRAVCETNNPQGLERQQRAQWRKGTTQQGRTK
jgi:hypothetical protein